MIEWIKNLFTKPTAWALLDEQMEESERLYIAHSAEAEYHKAQCEMHKARILRIAGQCLGSVEVRSTAIRVVGSGDAT